MSTTRQKRELSVAAIINPKRQKREKRQKQDTVPAALLLQPNELEEHQQKPAKRKKSRRRVDKDFAYKPKSAKRLRTVGFFNKGILHARCDKNRRVEDKAGIQKPVRIISMIDVSKMGPVSPRKLNSHYVKSLEENVSPSTAILIKVLKKNEFNSPIKALAITPTKDSTNTYILKRSVKLGCNSFLTNQKLLKNPAVVESIPGNHEFFNSELYVKIKKYFDAFKEQKTFITPALVKKTQKELKVSRNQQNLMKGSAGKCADETELFVPGLKWEWLHLVAHCILGAQSQDEDNLVGGTKESNTNMALIEAELKYLVTKFPEGFTLKVKAHLMKREESEDAASEYLQIATHLEYNIFVGDIQIPFDFNLQETNQPHIDYSPLIHAMFEAVVKLTMKVNDEVGEATVANDLPEHEVPMYCYRSTR